MTFTVYQCALDPDYFVVTDPAHEGRLPDVLGPSKGPLNRLGNYTERGRDRLAFDEALAKSSINKQGYYLFEATSFSPMPVAPEMPG